MTVSLWVFLDKPAAGSRHRGRRQATPGARAGDTGGAGPQTHRKGHDNEREGHEADEHRASESPRVPKLEVHARACAPRHEERRVITVDVEHATPPQPVVVGRLGRARSRRDAHHDGTQHIDDAQKLLGEVHDAVCLVGGGMLSI